MGFLHFSQKACDVVVLEVGLGGRLDSTNVIHNDLPLSVNNPPSSSNISSSSLELSKMASLSIITSIQLDHVKILGDTIEKIAIEKAGIMKPGVNVLVGPGCPIELLRVSDS